MSLKEAKKPNPGYREVIFYTKPEFKGNAYLSTVGEAVDISTNDAYNNKFGSIKLGEDACVLLYEGGCFSGINTIVKQSGDINIKPGCFAVLTLAKSHINESRYLSGLDEQSARAKLAEILHVPMYPPFTPRLCSCGQEGECACENC